MEYTQRKNNEDGGVLKTGFVLGGFSPIKSKKLLFAVLTDRSLQLYENEKAYRKKPKSPKHVVDLATAFNVQRDHYDAKLRHCVCLMGPDDCFAFKTEKPADPHEVIPEENMEWYMAIIQAIIPSRALKLGRPVSFDEFFEFCWDMEVVAEPKLKKPLAPSDRLPTMCGRIDGVEEGPQRLCFYPHTIVLCKRRVEPTTKNAPSSNCPPFNMDDFFEIQRNFVAFFGSHERFFVIKMGRGSPCGACELWLSMDSEDVANDVHLKLSYIIERESEKKKKAIGETLVSNPPPPPAANGTAAAHRDRSQTQPAQMRAVNGQRLCSPAASTSWIGRKSSGASMSGSLSSRCNTMSSTSSGSPVKIVKPNGNYVINYIPSPENTAAPAAASQTPVAPAPVIAPSTDATTPVTAPPPTVVTPTPVTPTPVTPTPVSPTPPTPTSVATTPVTPTPATYVLNYAEPAPSTANYGDSLVANGSVIVTPVVKTNGETYIDTNGTGETQENGDGSYCVSYHYGMSVPVEIANATSNTATISSTSSSGSGGSGTLWGVFPSTRRNSNASSIVEEGPELYQSMDLSLAPSPSPPPKPLDSVSTNGSVLDETEDSGGTLRLEGGEDYSENNYIENNYIEKETKEQAEPTERRSKDVPDIDEQSSVNGSVASSSGIPVEAMEQDLPFGSNNQLVVPSYDRYHSNMDDMKCVSDSSDSCYSSMATNSTTDKSAVVNTPRAYSFGGRGQIKPPSASGGDGDSKDYGANLGLPTDDPRKRAFSLGSKIFLPRPFQKKSLPNRQQRHSQTSASGVSLASSAGCSFQNSRSNNQIDDELQDEETVRQRSGSFGSGTSASYVTRDCDLPISADGHHVAMDFSGEAGSGSVASLDSASRSRTSSMGCARKEDYVQNTDEVPAEPAKTDEQTPAAKTNETPEGTPPAHQTATSGCTIAVPPEEVLRRTPQPPVRRASDEAKEARRSFLEEPVLETVNESPESKKSVEDEKPVEKPEKQALTTFRPLFSETRISVQPPPVEKMTIHVKDVEKAPVPTKAAKTEKSIGVSLFAKAFSLISSSSQKEKAVLKEKAAKEKSVAVAGSSKEKPSVVVKEKSTVVVKETDIAGSSKEKTPVPFKPSVVVREKPSAAVAGSSNGSTTEKSLNDVTKEKPSTSISESTGEKTPSVAVNCSTKEKPSVPVMEKPTVAVSVPAREQSSSAVVNGSNQDKPQEPPASTSNSKPADTPEQTGNSTRLVEKTSLGKALDKAKKKSVDPNSTPFEVLQKAAIAANKEKLAKANKHSNPFAPGILEKSSSQQAIERTPVYYTPLMLPQGDEPTSQPNVPLEKSASQPKDMEYLESYMTIDARSSSASQPKETEECPQTNYMTVDGPSSQPKVEESPSNYITIDSSSSAPEKDDEEAPRNYVSFDSPTQPNPALDYAAFAPQLSASSDSIHSTRPDRSASSPVREALSTPGAIPKRASVPSMRNDVREDSVINYAALEINQDDAVKPGSVSTSSYLSFTKKPGSAPQEINTTDYTSFM